MQQNDEQQNCKEDLSVRKVWVNGYHFLNMFHNQWCWLHSFENFLLVTLWLPVEVHEIVDQFLLTCLLKTKSVQIDSFSETWFLFRSYKTRLCTECSWLPLQFFCSDEESVTSRTTNLLKTAVCCSSSLNGFCISIVSKYFRNSACFV